VIFVTVGHQMPFDRLIRAVDAWAARAGRADLFAQVGQSQLRPAVFPAQAFLEPDAFQRAMAEAGAIVAHAGTGTIIAALRLGKPLLVLPRRAALGETRNDHQLATARHFASRGLIRAAMNESDLDGELQAIEQFRPAMRLGGGASPELIRCIREFIEAA
jgi:UDP-N-acetylglucosamine transferase subunit ALG13